MVDPDWDDNPDDLDSIPEVKAALAEAGLDPMDIDTRKEASFGHSVTHAFADDPGRGGRTPAQLEAEHDMTVEAMQGFGMDHDSELDLDDIR